MKAVALGETGIAVCDRAEPQAREGWAIVRVGIAGICNTDLELARGYMSFRGVLGHEFTGTVDDGPADWLGQRVVGEINFACGHCPTCRAGVGRHCPTRRVLGILDADGAFAERVAVPVVNLHRIPDAIDDDQAVFAEPLAAAFEILEQLHIEPAAECLVFGDGKLGLLVAQVLDTAGARVTVVGKHPENHALLRRQGIETIGLSDAATRTAPLVVDATGSADGFARAIAATRTRGTLVLKSTVAERMSVDMAPVVINEIRVVGSRCGPFVPALRALERGTIDVRSLVAAYYPLGEAAAAFEHAARPGTLKVLLRCGV
jgi:threonine dehydrogenase-like Zn-dependent dehydrogenase